MHSWPNARVWQVRASSDWQVRLSPEESVLLADVLDAALQFMSAMTGRPELDDTTPSSAELSYLAMEGGGFSWLAEEPELYSDGKLREALALT